MEEPSNNIAETDEETEALRKKRLRRVSFAEREITSVYIFKRDEDYETPPDSSASKSPGSERNKGKEGRGRFKDLADSDDSRELPCTSPAREGDKDDDVGVAPFLRPAESPSSWGTTGSATSNDEDNFFGPVSANFIRKGRLSDSAASEEDHDITMDSTAFSIHFRSLVGSESGDLKTHTGNHIAHEEQTPSQFTNRSDVMRLTMAKKHFPESSLAMEKDSNGRDSNDMSLSRDDSRKYDYGKLSPRLKAILTEANKDLYAVDACDNSNQISKSSESAAAIYYQDGGSPMGLMNHRDMEAYKSDGRQVQGAKASQIYSDLLKAKSNSKNCQGNRITHDCEPHISLSPIIPVAVVSHARTPDKVNRELQKVLNQMSVPEVKLTDVKGTPGSDNDDCRHNPFMPQETNSQHFNGSQQRGDFYEDRRKNYSSNMVFSRQCKSPSVRSAPLLQEKLHLKLLENPISARSLSFMTPPAKNAEPLVSVQKTNSKAKYSMISSPASALRDRIGELKRRVSLHSSSILSPSNVVRPEGGSDLKHRHADLPHINLEEQLSNAENPKETNTNTERDGYDILVPGVDTNLLADNAQSLCDAPAQVDQGKPASLITVVGSPSRAEEGHFVVSENVPGQMSMFTRSDSTSAGIVFDLRKQELSPKFELYGSVSDDCGQESCIFSGQKSTSDTKRPRRQKRKIEVLMRKSSRKSNEAEGNLNFAEHGNLNHDLVLYQPNESSKENESVSNSSMGIDWKNNLLKLSTEANNLLAQLADNWNTRLMGILEDGLTHLKRVHLTEILCSGIHSQKVRDQPSRDRIKRQADSRSLLCKLAYEMAKLQLLHIKHKELLRRIERQSLGIQKSELLRLDCINLQVPQPVRRGAQADDNHHSAVNFGSDVKVSVSWQKTNTEKATKLKQELEVLDGRIKNLKESFLLKCKMKGDPNCLDTVASIEDFMKTRICCRAIEQAMRLWKIDNVKSHDIILDYVGFLNQRLTIKSRPPSSATVCNKLNSDVIMKTFPNMDAWAAFAFVFSSESTTKYGNRKILAEETRITSSTLRNLLAVLNELVSARFELQNLIRATFSSPCAEQLHLQLGFIDSKSFGEVAVTIDMACLTRAIYPSKILPCDIQASSITLASALTAEIKTALSSVRPGYPRLIRLCRCISKVLQT